MDLPSQERFNELCDQILNDITYLFLEHQLPTPRSKISPKYSRSLQKFGGITATLNQLIKSGEIRELRTKTLASYLIPTISDSYLTSSEQKIWLHCYTSKDPSDSDTLKEFQLKILEQLEQQRKEK